MGSSLSTRVRNAVGVGLVGVVVPPPVRGVDFGAATAGGGDGADAGAVGEDVRIWGARGCVASIVESRGRVATGDRRAAAGAAIVSRELPLSRGGQQNKKRYYTCF